MNIIKKSLSNIDVSDIFFDSIRNDYPNFNEWFLRKKKENYYAYVAMDKNNKLLSFLMLKEENYQELNDVVKKFDLVNKNNITLEDINNWNKIIALFGQKN